MAILETRLSEVIVGVVLAARYWLSAVLLSSWRAIGPLLIVFSLSLLASCGGGGGSSGEVGREGASPGAQWFNTLHNGTSQAGKDSDAPAIQWSIVPFAGGLSIEWHNFDSFNQTGDLNGLLINITRQGSSGVLYSIDIVEIIDGIYNLTNLGNGTVLEDGITYKVNSLVLEYSDNSSRVLPINWLGGMNRLNQAVAGNEMEMGEDRIGLMDLRGTGSSQQINLTWTNLKLDVDFIDFVNISWWPEANSDNKSLEIKRDNIMSGTHTINGDFVMNTRYAIEVFIHYTGGGMSKGTIIKVFIGQDGDGDSYGDNQDNCPTIFNDQQDTDGDGAGDACDDDSDNDSIPDQYEASGCRLSVDCDNDSVGDSADIDDDGDGLIEIRTAQELDAVRHVLDGSGYKPSREATLNRTGCGGGVNITTCNGYELVHNISLADYITQHFPMKGWQPIGKRRGSVFVRGQFSGIFDGNGFVISNLSINRLDESDIGLFGFASGTIRSLGVVADNVSGTSCVGSLVGDGENIDIAHSYAVSNQVVGGSAIGGLVGCGARAEIIHSYAVSDEVRGEDHVGGLVGAGHFAEIIHSYAVSDEMRGENRIGGLIGHGFSTEINHSYAVSDEVRGDENVGGLVGLGHYAEIVHSYAVSGVVRGDYYVGGLVGDGLSVKTTHSYAVSDEVRGNDHVGGLVGQGMRAEITHSYAVSDEVRGDDHVGGLVGRSGFAEFIHSYAVSGVVRGDDHIGGLVGSLVAHWPWVLINEAKIIHSYAVSDEVRGDENVGGLVGLGHYAEIIHSYAVSGNVSSDGDGEFDGDVGGLVGDGYLAEIIHSYAVSYAVSGNNRVGGLVGQGMGAEIIQSYAMSGQVKGAGNFIGGLVGTTGFKTEIIQSYTVSGEVSGNRYIGGLVGWGARAEIIHSYAVSNEVSGDKHVGGLVGEGRSFYGSGNAVVSYWDISTSGSTRSGVAGASGQTSMALRLPTGYTGIYNRWDGGVMVDSIDVGSTIWCDRNNSGAIETPEQVDANKIWDFGTEREYPVIRCIGGSQDHQRAWWHPIEKLSKLQFNQTRLNRWLDYGFLPLDRDNDGMLNEGAGCILDTDCDDDEVLDGDEEVGCILNADCDNDSLADGEDACPVGERNWRNDGTNDVDSDGCRQDEDIDDDGDGLIEISTADELDAVRWVLNGSGLKPNQAASLDTTGCGNGENITICNGYELVNDISLTDYITERYPVEGWQPIAPDINTDDTYCQGDKFTGIFDGNSFEVSGLFINRPNEDCIGLFGQVDGMIHHLGVVADRIVGKHSVGGLVGFGSSAEIVHSYAVSGEVSGEEDVGGLVGDSYSAEIVRSYAVTGEVSGNNSIGGLVGFGGDADIVQSYAMTSEVSGNNSIGGLVGFGGDADIVQSYAMTSEVSGNNSIGGLVGDGYSAEIVHSYAVTGEVNGILEVGGLVGFGGSANSSYWDRSTSGRDRDAANGSQSQDTIALRSPTDYTGIYSLWDDGAIGRFDMIAGVNRDGTIWCDEDFNGSIEDEEMRDDSHMNGDNRIWDFGTGTDYPAIRCTSDSLANQRAWWYLNSTHKPQLNQTHLDAWLDGSFP